MCGKALRHCWRLLVCCAPISTLIVTQLSGHDRQSTPESTSGKTSAQLAQLVPEPVSRGRRSRPDSCTSVFSRFPDAIESTFCCSKPGRAGPSRTVGRRRKFEQRQMTGSADWFVYILECADGSLYTGIARDLDARIKIHNDGAGAKYTRGRLPVKLIYSEAAHNRSSALRREHEIKQWPRQSKLALSAEQPI